MLLGLLLLLLPLAHALPFITTWKTTQANEAIVLPPIKFQALYVLTLVEWGDSTSQLVPAGLVELNHTYATPGLYNVSINSSIAWMGTDAISITNATTKTKLVDIVSWGDVFDVSISSFSLFQDYINLKVSAPPDNQPVFSPHASLMQMFFNTSFNSPLNWDLTGVVTLRSMFAHTPLNQPITFRNTQRVDSITTMFMFATSFNQPFHFDASGVTDAAGLFWGCSSFNQVVNLTNSRKLLRTEHMFLWASSFNQPIFINTDSVYNMNSMFEDAVKFNQPVNFNTSQIQVMGKMFSNASAFNQSINFNVPLLSDAAHMFSYTKSLTQPVVLNTSDNFVVARYMFAESAASKVTITSIVNVTNMDGMFFRATGFTQDLSSWDTRAVTTCESFCPSCGLPSFPLCAPCNPLYFLTNISLIYTDPLTNISRCMEKSTTTTSSAFATSPSSLSWLVLGASIVIALASSGGSNP